jgi:hypothetical protein
LIGVNADGGESIGGAGCTGESFAIGDFGEAEVEDFGMAALGDENVGGFDVAMNDAFGVGSIEGIGNLDGEIKFSRSMRGPAIMCLRGWPSRNSMAMKALPLFSPMS